MKKMGTKIPRIMPQFASFLFTNQFKKPTNQRFFVDLVFYLFTYLFACVCAQLLSP